MTRPMGLSTTSVALRVFRRSCPARYAAGTSADFAQDARSRAMGRTADKRGGDER
jgi:hypothetical protein